MMIRYNRSNKTDATSRSSSLERQSSPTLIIKDCLAGVLFAAVGFLVARNVEQAFRINSVSNNPEQDPSYSLLEPLVESTSAEKRIEWETGTAGSIQQLLHVSTNTSRTEVLSSRALEDVGGDDDVGVSDNRTSSYSSGQRYNKYMHSLEANIGRGMNIINALSGCSVAVWIYRSNNTRRNITEDKVCREFIRPEKVLRDTATDASRIQMDDVVFCPNILLPEFVRDFLPWVQNPFVLLTIQYDYSLSDGIFNMTEQSAPYLIQSPLVRAWFTTDTPHYTGGFQDHPKVHSFPLGLKYRRINAFFTRKYGKRYDPIPHFQKAMLKSLSTSSSSNKTKKIFWGYFRNNGNTRHNIPSGRDLDYPQYLKFLSQSRYTISPSGDRPECHRHYEAIGLGSMPLTQLDSRYYGHFRKSVIYNHSIWSPEQLNLPSVLPDQPLHAPNRNMVFEEYWLAHVERELGGRKLRWWDVIDNQPHLLEEFAVGSHVSTVVQKIMGRPMNLSFPS